jgi:integrase
MARREIERLTDRVARQAPATGKPYMLADGNGLYLRVDASGSRSWILRYRSAGKRHDMGLGSYPLRTLTKARELARGHREALLDRIDPLAEREAKRKSRADAQTGISFRQAAEAWIKAKEAEWTAKHRADIAASFSNYAYPMIGDMSVAEVDTPAILRVIEPQWLTKTETVSRTRSRLEAVIGYAITAGYRPSGDNPARWDKHLENLLPRKSKIAKPEKFAAMDWQAMPEFMATLRARDGLTARALEFVILTAARAGEVISATWAEIDLEGRLRVIPAERMKAGREHRVPLSDAAVQLLRALPRDGDLVFGRLVHNSLIRLLDTFGLTNAAGKKPVVHGFRGTFKTWAKEHDYRDDVVEMALAHKSGDAVAERYTHTDLLRHRSRLADDWAAHLDGTEAKVVPLHVGARA